MPHENHQDVWSTGSEEVLSKLKQRNVLVCLFPCKFAILMTVFIDQLTYGLIIILAWTFCIDGKVDNQRGVDPK